MMDLNYWAQFNSEVVNLVTKKKYFDKYVFRITYIIPYGRATLEFADGKRNHKNLKFRIERSTCNVYSDDETALRAFHDSLPGTIRRKLVEISGPRDDAHRKLLDEGCITGTASKGYSYKILIREGRYDVASKHAIINYLDSLGDMVTVPPTLKTSLYSTYPYARGGYILSNDATITTAIELISPGSVGKVYKITKI